MELTLPPEPLELRKEIRNFLERHPELREEGGHAVADVAGYWYGNKLPRYLWKSGWGQVLDRTGMDKDLFMRTVGAHRAGFFRWIDGEASWEELIDLIARSTTKTAERLGARATAETMERAVRRPQHS